jgi:uncharacterized membrane protein YebE (DUF533 family)
MRVRKVWIAGALATVLGAGLMGSAPAEAGSKGRKNTALGLGAAAAYQLLRGKTTTGLALGAGAAYGYKRYKDSKEDEERYDRYSDRYRTNSRSRRARHDEYRRNSRSDDQFRFDDWERQRGRD